MTILGVFILAIIVGIVLGISVITILSAIIK